MCGLVGFTRSPGQEVESIALQEIVGALRHRGPDDSGVFEDQIRGIGLAHTRLSILDLSRLGHQPMASDDGHVVVVYNGEIYNFRELRTELRAMGHTFHGHSDTEVLLHWYLEHRENGNLSAAMCRLNGVFAFALWDADRGAMLLSRDALGVKPLYYYASDGLVVFSSEIKAIQKIVPSLGELDYAALQRYLSFLWCPGNGTPFRRVRKLGPGECIWLKDGAVAEHFTWYNLPGFRILPSWMNESEATRGVVTHLRQAVHRQMVADVPVGAFLSGGLDSSSVVAFAKEVNPDIRCFTIEQVGGAEPGMTDDLPYARRAAAHLKVPLEVVRIDAGQMAKDLVGMVAQLDEPLADPAPLNVLYISRLARESGLKVLLSGAGGDDIFTGYRRHRALVLERYWSWLPVPVRKGLEKWSGQLDQRKTLGRRLHKLFSGASLNGDARLVNYFVWSGREDLISLYSSEFRAALVDTEAYTPMTEFLAGLPATVSPLERMLILEQRFFLADHNLTYTDKMSMAAGVEVRVPFLDLDLVEFAAHIPANFKQRGSEGKWVLKKAMEPYLPSDVIYRPKSGFGAPLRRWMRFELRELLGDVLGADSLRRRGLFEPAAVQCLITANDRGELDASYTLLSLMCIELWCRRFIDQAATKTNTRMESTP